MFQIRFAALVALALGAAACEVVPPSNPFDPATPSDQQALAAISGTVELIDPFDASARARQLEAVRIGLLDEGGRRLAEEGLPLARALIDVEGGDGEDRGRGRFVIEKLTPGTYTLVVEGVPAFYERPVLPTLRLLPGGELELEPVAFAYVGDGGAGPGLIEGSVRAEGAAAGQHRVTLFSRQGDTVTALRALVTGGDFELPALPLGSYAVVVESDGFAPAYRLDVEIGEGDGAALRHTFRADAEIVLHPVTAVLLPATSPEVIVDEGEVYTRAAEIPLAVLSFGVGDVGVTGMRLSSDPGFVDESGAPLAFSPYEAAASVALPDREGRVRVHAQFEARSPGGFSFTSPVFSLEILRDVSPPRVVEASFPGLARDAAGTYLSPDDSLLLTIDAIDDVSAIDALAVGLGDVPPDAFVDVTSPPGLARFEEELIAATDGETRAWIVLEDRAGNRSEPVELPVLVDSSPPDVALVVDNAGGGVLASRVAQLSFDEAGATADLPVAMQVRVVGDPFSEVLPYGATELVVSSSRGSHGDTVAFEARLFDRVGNEVIVSRDVALSLTGAVVGVAVPESVPLLTPSAAGVTVRLFDAEGALVDEVITGADGSFALTQVPEGSGYSLTAELEGYRGARRAGISVPSPAADGTPSAVDLEAVPLAVARGDLAGRVRLADAASDDGAHAAIVVSLSLDSPDGRVFSTSTVTDAAGDFVFRGLPATRATERVHLEARRQDYGVASTDSAVVADQLTTLTTLLLPRNRGDFDVCRPTGACTPVEYVNTDTVRIRLRDPTDVASLVVSIDAGTPTTLPIAADNLTPVSLGGAADGEVEISVQAEKQDGSRGEVLTARITKDTAPPSGVTVSRVADPLAHDGRFTAKQLVEVIVDADPGTGAVAPLDTPRLVVADIAPGAPPAALPGCAHAAPCRLALPGAAVDAVEEKLHRVFAYSCDAAGNCAAPEQTFVIYDATPPEPGHGAAFRVVAAGSVLDESGPDPIVVLPSPFYAGEISLGRAATGAGAEVLDEGAQPIADVFAFRLSLSSATLARATLQTFTDPPVADDVRASADVEVPALPSGTATHTVFAQLVDAAGNASLPFTAFVRVDDDPPDATVVLNDGAPTASTSVPLRVDVPVGGEAPTRLEVSVDGGAPQPFTLPLDAAARVVLPAVEGARRVVVLSYDAVGNVSRSESIIVLDQSGPRIDDVACAAATCQESGGILLTRAADARLDLSVVAVDTLTAVAEIEVSVDGAAPQVFPAGAVSGIALAPQSAPTLTLVAVDAVGNRGAPSVQAVIHDTEPPVIDAFVVEDGANSTSRTQVAVRVDVAAGDAVESRFATSTSFSGPFAPFRADDFFVLAGADGSKQICVEVRDSAQNAASACDTILLDRDPPVGSVTIPSGASTSAASIDVELSYPADTARVAVSTTALSCAASTTPYVAATGSPQTVSVSLGDGDGARTLFACFEDGAGNAGSALATVTVDRTAPDVALELDGGATYTLDEEVGVTLTSSADATGMAVAVDTTLDCASATYTGFAASSTVSLPLAGGSHTVSACVRDAVGNLSPAPATATIILDLTPPTGTLVLDGGALFTRDEEVSATLTRSDDVVEMALAPGNTLDCGAAQYAAFQAATAVRLASTDGLQTVSACLRDAAGRTTRLTDTITLDRAAPTGTLVVAGGADTTPVRDVTATLTFSADVVGVAVSAFPLSCDTATFVAPATSADVSLPFVGQNTVTACLRDSAGNTSALTDDIFLEDNAGDSLVVAIEGGSATARSRDVLVSLFRPSTDFTQMKVVEAPSLDCTDLTGYEAFLSPKPLTLSAGTAPSEGSRTVSACVRNPISGVTKAASDTIFVDTFAPDGSIEVGGGALVTRDTTVTVSLTNAFAGDGEVVTVALSGTSSLVGGDCTGSFEAFQATKTFAFSGGDGNRTVFACLRDSAGNTREVSDSIVLDREAPSPVSLTVPPLIRSTSVTATLSFPADATEVAVSEGALDCETTTAYQPVPAGNPATLGVTLAAIDGPHTLFACFRDGAGNASQATTVTTLDRTAPTGTVVIDQGATYATSRDVTVAVQGVGDAVAMARVESATAPSCDAQTYEAFVSNAPFTLTSAGDGAKTVHVCLEDAAGNRALALPDTILLDSAAPNGALVVEGGAAATRSRSVTLEIDAGGNTDVASYAVAEGTITCNASNLAYSPFASVTPFLLSTGDGDKTVLVCLKDLAGNVSTAAASATIRLDTTPPALATPAVSVQDGDGFVQSETSASVALAWTTAGDVASVKVAEGAIDCASDSGYQAVSAAATTTTVTGVSLSAAEGSKLVLACFRDEAGNVATGQDTTVRDSARPGGRIEVAGGAAYVTEASEDVVVTLAMSTDTARFALVETTATNGACAAPSLSCSTATYETFAGTQAAGELVATKTLNLAGSPAAGGQKCFEACFEDGAGNRSEAAVLDAVQFDATAPSVAFALSRREEDTANATFTEAFTRERDVVVRLDTLSSDATEIAVAEGTLSCGSASYESLPSPLPPLPFERTFTLAAGSDGTRTVSVCVRDAAGNPSGVLGTTDTIELDTTPPQVTMSIAGGATYATSASAPVSLSSTPSNDVLARVLSTDPSIDCNAQPFTAASFGTLPASVTQALSAGDGDKIVVGCFRDRAGNVTKASDSILLDTSAPSSSFAVDQGATFATDTSVTADFSNVSADVTLMKLSTTAITDCAAATGYVAFVNGTSVSLPAGDGSKTVYACLRDAAGNSSEPLTDTIRLDTQNPTVALSLVSASNSAQAGFTPTTSVLLRITALASDSTAIAVANSSIDCGTASFEALPQPLPAVPFERAFQLSAGTDGTRTVAVCVKDAAGRTNGTTGTSANITLDTTPPSVVIALNGGAPLTNDGDITLSFTPTPSTDALRYVLRGGGAVDCTQAPFTGAFAALPASDSTTLDATASGTKTVVGCFQDRAGNVASAADDIILDVDRPVLSDLSCASCNEVGGGFYTNGGTATFDVVAASPDVVEVITMVHNDVSGARGDDRACTGDAQCRAGAGEVCREVPVDGTGTPALRCVEVHAPTSVVVTLASATHPITAAAGSGIADVPPQGEQQVLVVLEDAGGNHSQPAESGVFRDTIAPTATFALSGSNVTNQQVVFVRNLVADDSPTPPDALGTFAASSLSTFSDVSELPYTTSAVMSALAFPVTLTAGDGAKTVFVRVTDNAGNSVTATQAIELDTTAPTDPRFANAGALLSATDGTSFPALAVPSTDANLRSPRPYEVLGITSGTCDALAEGTPDPVELVGGRCEWNGSTPFTLTASSLTEGENRIRVRAHDTAGNTSADDFVVVTLDTTRPPAPSALLFEAERDSAAAVSWGRVDDDDVAGYLVSYGTDPDTYDGAFANEGDSPIFVAQPPAGASAPPDPKLTLSGLTNNTPFFFKIESVDAAGNTSLASLTGQLLPNPVAPRLVGSVARSGSTASDVALAVSGSRAYSINGSQLCVYDVSTNTPAELGCRDGAANLSGALDRLVLHGRFAYVAQRGDNSGPPLRVVDISSPTSPGAVTLLDIDPTPANVSRLEDLTFVGHNAIGARDREVVVLRQPATTSGGPELEIIQRVALPVAPGAVAVDASTEIAAVVYRDGSANYFLRVYPYAAVSPSLALDSTGFVDEPLVQVAEEIVVDGRTLYVAGMGGVEIFQVETTLPLTMSRLGEIGGFDCSSIDVLGGHLYCNDRTQGSATALFIHSTEDLGAPPLAGRSLAGEAPILSAIDVEENRAVAVDRNGALSVIELWQPLRYEASGGTSSLLDDAVLSGNRVIAVGNGRLRTFDVSDARAPTLSSTLTVFDRDRAFEVEHGVASYGTHMAVAAYDWNVTSTFSRLAFRIVDPVSGPVATVTRPANGNCGDTTGAARTIDVQSYGNLVFTARSDGIVEAWASMRRDVGGNLLPSCLGHLVIPGVKELSNVTDGSLFAITDAGELHRIVLNPATGVPSLGGSLTTGGVQDDSTFGGLAWRGDTLYVSRSPLGPGEPALARYRVAGATITQTQTQTGFFGTIGVAGEHLVVADGFRIGTPSTPGSVSGIFAYEDAGGAFTLRSMTQAVRAPRSLLVGGAALFGVSDSGLQSLIPSR